MLVASSKIMRPVVAGVLVLLVTGSSASMGGHHLNHADNNDVQQHRQVFFQWMKEHGKEYSDSKELLARMNVWMENHGKRADNH